MAGLAKSMREYLAWRSAGDPAAEAAAEELGSIPLTDWPDYLASHPEFLAVPVLTVVLDAAHAALDGDIAPAVELTRFVVENLLHVAPAPPPVDVVFRGRA